MAGVNRFSRPAQQNFINTYVPIPFDELSAAADKRQTTLDTSRANLATMQATANNLDSISNSIDSEYVDYTRKALDELGTKYSSVDLSDPTINRELTNELKNAIDSARLSDIQKSAIAWKAKQQRDQKLHDEGQYLSELDEDPSKLNKFDSRKGVYNYNTPAYVKARPVGEAYFNDLEESSRMKKDPTTGLYYINNYINDSMIRDTARSSITSFLDTPAGRQAIDLAKKRGIYGKNADGSEKNDFQLAEEVLFDIGKERLKDRIAGFAPGQKVGGQNPTPPPRPPIDNAAIPVTDVGTPNTKNTAKGNRIIKRETTTSKDMFPSLNYTSDEKEHTKTTYVTGPDGVPVPVIEHTDMNDPNHPTNIFRNEMELLRMSHDKGEISNKKFRDSKRKLRRTHREKLYDYGKDRIIFEGENAENEEKLFNDYIDAASEYYGYEIGELPGKELKNKVDDYIKYRQVRYRSPEVTGYYDAEGKKKTLPVKDENYLLNISKSLGNRAVYDPEKPKEQDLLSVHELSAEYPFGEYVYSDIGTTNDIPRDELSTAKQIDIYNKKGVYQKTVFVASDALDVMGTGQFRNKLGRALLYNEQTDKNGRVVDNFLPHGTFKFPHGGSYWNVHWNVEEHKNELPLYSLTIEYPPVLWSNKTIPEGISGIKGRNLNEIMESLLYSLKQNGQW